MAKRGAFLLAAILAISALILLVTWARKPSAADEKLGEQELPRIIQVGRIDWSTEAIPLRASGILSRREESALGFYQSGLLTEVLVRPGDRVKRGQVLARLSLEQMEAELEQAHSLVEKYRREVSRTSRLVADHAASEEELQGLQTELTQAEAQMKFAQFARRHAEILAPDDGAILTREAEPNEWVEAGRPILRFGSDCAGWIVTASVSERDARNLRPGDRAFVEEVQGQVTRIAEAVDRETRTVHVEVDCESPPAGARSGRVMELVLEPRPVARHPRVPASSLIEGSGGSCRIFLWNQAAGTVSDVEVAITGLLDDMACLKANESLDWEWVVTRGAEFLRDGMKVERDPTS